MPSPLTLVLLPGMDGTGVLFAPLLAALPAHVTAQVVRYPGDQPLSYDALLARVVAELPTKGEYVLVGESFSGPIALRVAATRPAGLLAVVLCASFTRTPVRVPAWLALAVRPGLVRASPFALQAPIMLGRGADPTLRALLREALTQVSPHVLAARARELLRVDASSALGAATAPLLYLRATRDQLVSPRSRDHLLRLRPAMHVVDVDGKHLLLQTQPTACWQAIDAFVSGA